WLAALPLFYTASRVLGITRYVLVLAPLLVCYGWTAIAYYAGRPSHRPGAWIPRALVLVAGALAHAGNAFVFSHHVVPQARAFERILDGSMIPTAKGFGAHTPPGTRVAIPHGGVF